MELGSLPQVGSLSVEVVVPRGEVVGSGVSVEVHLSGFTLPFELAALGLILVNSGPSLLLNSGWPAVLEVNWRLSLSATIFVLLWPVSTILLVIVCGSSSKEECRCKFEHLTLRKIF